MITPAQRSRLYQISDELRTAKRHPSLAVKVSVTDVSEKEIEESIEKIIEAMNDEDGHKSFKIIQSWHLKGTLGVIEYLRTI